MALPNVGDKCRFFPGDSYEASPTGQPIPATIVAVRANGLVDVQFDTAPTRRDALPFLNPGDDLPRWGSYVMSAA